jgi:hypothetical protein
LANFRERFPSRDQVLPVFAAAAFPIYSWMVLRLFWILPSWLKFLTFQEILIASLYAFAFALLESAALTLSVVLLAAVLPRRFFREQFIAQGSLLVWLICLWSGWLLSKVGIAEDWSLRRFASASLALLALFCASSALICYLAARRFPPSRSAIENLAERMTVFLLAYLPLSALGWAVVIARNLWLAIGG